MFHIIKIHMKKRIFHNTLFLQQNFEKWKAETVKMQKSQFCLWDISLNLHFEFSIFNLTSGILTPC